MKVELKVLDERVRAWGLPRYQSAMAAAVDLFACVEAPLVLAPQSAAQFVPAGIAIHIADPNVAAIIVPRSGLGHKKGLVLGNLVGVLDADYTGPILISVWNRSEAGLRTDRDRARRPDRPADVRAGPAARRSR